MLYPAYEARRALTKPIFGIAEAGARVLGSASGALADAPLVRAGLAWSTTVSALQLTHVRPSFGIEAIESRGRVVEVREETVHATPFGSLRHFAKEGGSGEQPKVLILPGLAGHFATLVRGTIATMLADHDVYVADWHNARDVPADAGRFGLDEFIGHVISFLDEIGPGTHLVAVCQPCVPALAAAALMAQDNHPARPASLTLMSGPVDARINPGPINEFSNRQSIEKLEKRAITTVPWPHKGAGRRVYPGFLQVAGFMSMAPKRHAKAFGSLFADVALGRDEEAARTEAFYDEYFAVLDIAAEFYLETARKIFVEHHLARGILTVKGRPVDPSAITSPLLTVEAANDEMCPPGQTRAAHDLCTGIAPEDCREHLQEGVGHYGVFSGSRFDREIYPVMRDFITAAQPALAAA